MCICTYIICARMYWELYDPSRTPSVMVVSVHSDSYQMVGRKPFLDTRPPISHNIGSSIIDATYFHANEGRCVFIRFTHGLLMNNITLSLAIHASLAWSRYEQRMVTCAGCRYIYIYMGAIKGRNELIYMYITHLCPTVVVYPVNSSTYSSTPAPAVQSNVTRMV